MKQWAILFTIIMFGLLIAPLKGLAARENTPYILFVSAPEKNDEVFILDLQSNRIRNLTNKTSRDWHPTWSSDGTRIAFNSDRDGNEEIYVMDANGLNQTDLSNNAAQDLAPDWSPVADQIAFISNRDGGYDLYILNVADGNVTRVTTDGQAKSEPDWSPDGTQIVYRQQQGQDVVINIVTVASGAIKTIVDKGQNLWPAWSPDGTQIAYFAQGDQKTTNIFTVNLATSTITNLTNDASNDARPEWSPDGSEIAFISDRDGNFNLYVMNADGSDPRRLTDTAQDDTSPSWQPVAAPIDFAANPLLGQGAIQVLSQNINATDQSKLGNWQSQVLAPTQANYKATFRIRVEVVPPGVSASTPVPGTTVQDSSPIEAYRYMGAELVGLDLQDFDILPDPSRYLLQIRDDEVNYWEWELRAKSSDVIGMKNLGVRLFTPAIPQNNLSTEEELKLVYFNVEIVAGDTPADSAKYIVDKTKTETEGFSVFFSDENSLTIFFANSTDIGDMRLATTKMEIALADIPEFTEQGEQMQPNSCVSFVLEGATPEPPSQCPADRTYTRTLVAGDVFWYDGHLLPVTIRKDGTADKYCSPGDNQCDF